MTGRRITSLRVIAIGFVAMLATMLGVGTASAHSAVVASDPANGAQIATAPARVSLTFNEALQEKFASLTVVGPDGNLWSKGNPSVQGDTVSVPLEGLGPVGDYTIAFRVTSADGHPVSGTQVFTLTQEGTGTPGPKAGGGGQSSNGSDESSDGGNTLIWVFVGVGVVVVAGGLWFALRKPRGQD
ncbi:copper resistance protein CopC [Prescottella agglutinans]|uniref:Copper resistance protein CopC n=1 Tax=Prescottella agglutinans TaxID=1644129 RepID=A0A438BA07_9NOCA|nr:copper resistance CopC family protein [Prescottella agglutinans]RVW07823.1 copper resistance protein CopC [Prescottella agglutinans]